MTSVASVILPVHNQADHVEEAVREYARALERLPAESEVILVVNGSTDRSLAICTDLESELEGVRVISSERGGWGHAVLLGLDQARGDLLCYTNLARTRAEDLVLLLLYGLAHPGVVVKANRKIRDSRYRRLGSLLYNLECRALFDLQYWDINGTPKVFPRELEKLRALTRRDDLIDVEFNIVCRREGYPVIEVPILSNLRRGGRSTTSYRSALRLYWGAIDLWRSLPEDAR